MSKHKVRVTVFAAKDERGNLGMLTLKVRIPPHLWHRKKQREAYTDGVADGIARMMQHYQPEGEGERQ